MTSFDPFSGKRVPARRPGDDIAHHARMCGWEDGVTIVDQVQARIDQDRALRHARTHGILIGMSIAVACFSVAVALRIAIQDHWPVACDGTGSLIVCGLRLIGVPS